MSAKITYETEECSRCLGSGRYSYNDMDGSRCFKCNGSGKQLTRRGKAARKRIAQEKERYHRRAADLEVGQRIEWRGVTVGGGTYHTFAVVEGVDPDPHNTGHVEIRLLERGKKPIGLNTWANDIQPVLPTPEQFRNDLVPLARKLKGATVTGTCAEPTT